MIKRIFIILFLLLAILFGALFFLIQQPFFWEKTIPLALNSQVKEVQISDMKIGKFEVRFFSAVNIRDARWSVKQGQDVYAMHVKQISLEKLGNSAAGQKNIRMVINGFGLESALIKADALDSTIDINLGEGFHLKTAQGSVQLKALSTPFLKAKDTSFKFLMNEEQLMMSSIQSALYQKDKFSIWADELTFKPSPLELKENLHVALKQGRIKSESLNVDKANLDLDLIFGKAGITSLKGSINAASADANHYKISDASSTISGTGDKITFEDFNASFYQGTMKGKIVLETENELPYIIEISLGGVDLSSMSKANEAIFSQVKGRMNGNIHLEGNGQIIHSFKMNFDVPQGGEIKAALLKLLLDYIPASTQRNDLEMLIKNNGNLPLERAEVRLNSISDKKLNSTINLDSAKINLKTNLNVDINIEDGFKNFLVNFERFIQSIREEK